MCSVVLSSGPDEALMGRCAFVMAGWSTEMDFVGEMGLRPEAGSSLAVLMRSVTPATRVISCAGRHVHVPSDARDPSSTIINIDGLAFNHRCLFD